MLARPIPSTGELLPILGLGTWARFDVPAAQYGARGEVMERFVALGGRLIDTSPMYGQAERAIGDLAQQHALSPHLFVATKVWTRGEQEGIQQMNESFEKLRVGRVDLMQVHNLLDVDTHLRTLRAWKDDGRVRYVGVTHYTVDSHPLLEKFIEARLVDFVQFNYSLAVPDAERRLLPLAAEHGVATLINRPFESGGMFRRIARAPLPPAALALECDSWAAVFLKYVISHPAVTCVIPATADPAHLEQNMRAAAGPLPDETTRRELADAWRRAS